MAQPTSPADPELAIQSHALSRSFGRLVAVDRLDLEVEKAQIYGFLGPNGSGKSTTIRMLCGLLTPTGGSASVLGLQVPRDAEALRSKIGYMTQRFSLYEDLSVHENLEFLGRVQSLPRHRRRRRIPQQLRDFDLEELEDQRAGTLSGGQRQRLALAAATLHEPELLLLDEPTSAVDPQSRRDFWEQLFVMIDHGTTILVSTHFMDEAERCHKLAILDHGRLVAAGRPRDLIEQIGVTVVEIETDRPRSAHRCLDGLAAIRSVAQLGTRLHALVDPAYDNIIEDLDRIFRDAGISASSAVTRANLEDVFVEATRPTAPTASSESPS